MIKVSICVVNGYSLSELLSHTARHTPYRIHWWMVALRILRLQDFRQRNAQGLVPGSGPANSHLSVT